MWNFKTTRGASNDRCSSNRVRMSLREDKEGSSADGSLGNDIDEKRPSVATLNRHSNDFSRLLETDIPTHLSATAICSDL
ncbi:hypothetical protein CN148_31150 [Sinorhizobium meliloti]|nr:hypothetical protein CN148_31150 [Sinorhizobium meliloti]